MDSKTLKMPLTSSCKWVFLIFPPLHSAPNPPMSQYFSFSPCSLSTFHLHTPSTTFSLSLSWCMSPLFTFVLPWSDFRQVQFFWPLVPCPAASLSTGLNKSDDQFSLSFAARWHTRTYPKTATERRNQLSLAACQPITTPHHQPCHLSSTCVPPQSIHDHYLLPLLYTLTLLLSPLITHCAKGLPPTGLVPLIVLHLQPSINPPAAIYSSPTCL